MRVPKKTRKNRKKPMYPSMRRYFLSLDSVSVKISAVSPELTGLRQYCQFDISPRCSQPASWKICRYSWMSFLFGVSSRK